MFFEKERIMAVREMILAPTLEKREKALNKILPMQTSDFKELFKQMKNLPVTIRFLDPPLHEFLPKEKEDIITLSKELNVEVEKLEEKINNLKEFNPMLGHRGVRLSITYPEITKMQTKAVITAAIEVSKELNIKINPEIMIPLVGDIKELDYIKKIVNEIADNLIKESGSDISYTVGTMIEVPRACIVADELAGSAEFFSFGTNDLTQMTYGFSRDDAGKFLTEYYDKKILQFDPFAKLDEKGVGTLIALASRLGRKTRKDLKVGICGEQAANPASIDFLNKVGLNYVSCSPFRIPIAILSAAQSEIKQKSKK
jgi:pyruvate,orthophosphate dikinase